MPKTFVKEKEKTNDRISIEQYNKELGKAPAVVRISQNTSPKQYPELRKQHFGLTALFLFA